MKNVMKEVGATLLGCIAILLILAVILYDYNPMNKEIHSTIIYETLEELDISTVNNNTVFNQNKDEYMLKNYIKVTEGTIQGYVSKTKNFSIYELDNGYVFLQMSMKEIEYN